MMLKNARKRGGRIVDTSSMSGPHSGGVHQLTTFVRLLMHLDQGRLCSIGLICAAKVWHPGEQDNPHVRRRWRSFVSSPPNTHYLVSGEALYLSFRIRPSQCTKSGQRCWWKMSLIHSFLGVPNQARQRRHSLGHRNSTE